MQFGIALLMVLVAVVALIRGIAVDLIGTVGAVLLALLILSLLASYTPRGCIQKNTCTGDLYVTAQVTTA